MPNISRTQVWKDIRKLDQFVTRFGYERAVFLAVNIEPQRIQEILAVRPDDYAQLGGTDRIQIVTKRSHHERTLVRLLNG